MNEKPAVLPTNPDPVLRAFVKGLKSILQDKLGAVYLYGAAASTQSEDLLGDIDFHVIVKQPLNAEERGSVDDLQRDLENRYPLGPELDGYYILLSDARGPSPPGDQRDPRLVDHSWALHRVHLLAGSSVVLYGPEPSAVYLSPTWDELEAALDHEIEFIKHDLGDGPAYCVLNLCRVLYSFQTKEVVVSKRRAGEWALKVLPGQYAPLIEASMRWYRREASSEQENLLRSGVHSFFDFMIGEIRSSRGEHPDE